jgi:hypothetical protein
LACIEAADEVCGLDAEHVPGTACLSDPDEQLHRHPRRFSAYAVKELVIDVGKVDGHDQVSVAVRGVGPLVNSMSTRSCSSGFSHWCQWAASAMQ